MQKEADAMKLASSQAHQNIVQFLGFEQNILAMEYCSEGDLAGHIGSNGLAPNDFEQFFLQFFDGIKYLRGLNLSHRDLKPDNMLIVLIGQNKIYKISDFGASRLLKPNQRYGSIYGTPEYCHPDIYAHSHPINLDVVLPKKEFQAEHEIWSIAVTVYHVATGKLPFEPNEKRDNPTLMYRMLTEKKAKHISADETENGSIKFNSRLPSSCELDDSLKQKIAALLAGMLKVNIH